VFRSLRLRMALSHALVIAVVLAAVGATGYVLIARSIDHDATSTLSAAAAGEADRIAESGHVVDPADTDTPSATAIKIAVFTLARAVYGETADVPSWLRPQDRRVVTTSARNERVRIVTLTAQAGGKPIALVVAGRSLAAQDALLSDLRWTLLIGGLVAVALAFGIGWILAFAAAEPIRRSYEAQERFAADASHELRTPLAFLRSGLEVAAERDPELGAEMLREVGYLTALTSRLLTLARPVEAASVVLEPAPLASLCRASIARATRVLDVAVELRCPDDVTASVDPAMFEAALDALLETVAVHGGGGATLACEARDDRVVVSVADHGAGIEPGLRARALEPFFRIDAARSRERGGAGLGLALVAKLVDAQNGAVSLGETAGGGLTVTMTFRRAPDA
jgi:signal transduction histidine kinase